MSITLTPSAAQRLRNYLVPHGQGVAVRFGVKKSGCSGFAYVVEVAEEIAAGDTVFEDQGVKLVVDRESLAYVAGTRVDFGKKGLNESFRFHNPNVKNECDCGESFTV
jgi:iron-sulfur cluster assembly protein